LLLRRLKQVSTALGVDSASLPSLELPKLAPSLQSFQLLLHYGLRAPLLLASMLQHGLRLLFTLALCLLSFINQLRPSQQHHNIMPTSTMIPTKVRPSFLSVKSTASPTGLTTLRHFGTWALRYQQGWQPSTAPSVRGISCQWCLRYSQGMAKILMSR
jgi:hypothetical protein